MPGVRMSTTKYVMPRCASASGSVRASRMPHCATCARVVHTFWPLTTYSSPSRMARVASDERSLPAPGSLNSWHQISEPSSRPGNQRCCWASVPATSSVGPAQPIPIGLSGRGTRNSRLGFVELELLGRTRGQAPGLGPVRRHEPRTREAGRSSPAGISRRGAFSRTNARSRSAGEIVLGRATSANLFHPRPRSAPNTWHAKRGPWVGHDVGRATSRGRGR